MIFSKKKTLDVCETEKDMQEYYDQHIWNMPEGCRACGGPYPSCMDSCSMYDDD